MRKFKIPLFDNLRQRIVDAWLVEGIGLDEIAKANAKWTRIKRQYRNDCKRNGLSFPEHSHWNWESKAEYSTLFDMIQTRFGIVCRGEIQGLMLVERLTQLTKLPPDKGEPLIYIKFIEVAPQNLEPFANPRQFLGIGGQFISSAIRYSIEMGFGGRIGLHALPQAEQFYRSNGMVEFDKDPLHENLRYYEFTCQQAQDHDSPKRK